MLIAGEEGRRSTSSNCWGVLSWVCWFSAFPACPTRGSPEEDPGILTGVHSRNGEYQGMRARHQQYLPHPPKQTIRLLLESGIITGDQWNRRQRFNSKPTGIQMKTEAQEQGESLDSKDIKDLDFRSGWPNGHWCTGLSQRARDFREGSV